jgi:hypothetical protein
MVADQTLGRTQRRGESLLLHCGRPPQTPISMQSIAFVRLRVAKLINVHPISCIRVPPDPFRPKTGWAPYHCPHYDLNSSLSFSLRRNPLSSESSLICVCVCVCVCLCECVGVHVRACARARVRAYCCLAGVSVPSKPNQRHPTPPFWSLFLFAEEAAAERLLRLGTRP